MNRKELAKYIDQTLLSATATEEQVKNFCIQAKEHGFKSVCINPCFVKTASEILKGSGTDVCTVIDFPLGAGGLESKCSQADICITNGAKELDYVINLGLVKAHKWKELEQELSFTIRSAREAAMFSEENAGITTKLILETCLLTDEEIVESSKCAKNAGFDFVKTSTGFAIVKDADGNLLPNGATVHAVELMRKSVGPDMGVKASGGIHSTQQALELIAAGASRIGASAGIKIIEGLEN